MNEPQPVPRMEPIVEGERQSLNETIHRIANALTTYMGSGEIASLRRLTPDDPVSPAFFRVVAQFLEPHGHLKGAGPLRDLRERQWACIIGGLAQMGGLHQGGTPLGEALAEAGFSELRFVRLLKSDQAGLWNAVRGAVCFLASKGQAANWTDMAEIVLSDGEEWSETVRRRIARRYYSYLMKTQEGESKK